MVVTIDELRVMMGALQCERYYPGVSKLNYFKQIITPLMLDIYP